MSSDELNADHPLLHPDIFAIIAHVLGECISASDFWTWTHICKRAVRLLARNDVSATLHQLRLAYSFERGIKISQQIILPYDLICRMIKINAMNLFDLPIHRRTFALCQIAVIGISSIVTRLRLDTKLTENEIFTLWQYIVKRNPSYIQDAEDYWDGERLDALADIAVTAGMESMSIPIRLPVSPFMIGIEKRLAENWRKRRQQRQFWQNATYAITGGIVGCVVGLHVYDNPIVVILTSLGTTIGSMALHTFIS